MSFMILPFISINFHTSYSTEFQNTTTATTTTTTNTTANTTTTTTTATPGKSTVHNVRFLFKFSGLKNLVK